MGGHQVNTVIAVLAALVAAFCFAAASLVQQTVARASGAGIFVLSRSSIVTAEQSAPREPAVATMRGVVMAEGD